MGHAHSMGHNFSGAVEAGGPCTQVNPPDMGTDAEHATGTATESKQDGNNTRMPGVAPSTKAEKRQPGYALKTEVRPSTIPGAGMGLFMCERARKGERIARYTGEIITTEEAQRRTSQYILKVNASTAIDAEADMMCAGRWINTCKGKNNAKPNALGRLTKHQPTGKWYVSIEATKTIKPGEEIFMPYGKSFSIHAETTTPAMMQRQTSRRLFLRALDVKTAFLYDFC